MSVNLSNSEADHFPTYTSTINSEPFSYIRNSNDLTEFALDFAENELPYYDDIKSYTTDNKISLFICVNGLVSVGSYYESSGEVLEFIRNNDNSDKKFLSINSWYNDYYGEAVSIDKVLDNVFIGEDLIPLWKVLEDFKEELPGLEKITDELEEVTDELEEVTDEVEEVNELDYPLPSEPMNINNDIQKFISYVVLFLTLFPMFTAFVISVFN
jgi:hypothetical protein